MKQQERTELRPRQVLWAVLLLVLLAPMALAISACSSNIRTGEVEIYGIARLTFPAFPETGANAIEVYNEMHYQPSYRSQEGPRLLPPADSVPVTGRELTYASLDEYRPLTVPYRVSQSFDPAVAAELFRVNCQVCHGAAMRGQGPMRAMMKRGPLPADLMADLSTEATEGELFAFISNGGRQGYAAIERGRASASPMPEFQFLLTEEERWGLVMYLRSKQASQ